MTDKDVNQNEMLQAETGLKVELYSKIYLAKQPVV